MPLAYASYRRSAWGIAATLIALATSMFWFPAPDRPDPRAVEFLRAEREWLAAPWGPAKVLMALAAPLSLGAFCLAFWKRSLVWDLVLLNGMALGKMLWSVIFGGESGLSVFAPAVLGLVVGNVAVLVFTLRRRQASPRRATTSR